MAKLKFFENDPHNVRFRRIEDGRCESTKEDMQEKVFNEVNEWQLCPKCNGEGSRPDYGYEPLSIDGIFNPMPLIQCDLCNGRKIISKVNGLPPQ